MDSNALKDRFEGCLLGGAAGDALGYAIEFWNEPNIGTQGDESHMPDPAHPKMWLYGESLLHALRAPGNIIGALVGKIALEQAFDLSFLESYDLIVKAADSLLA